MGHFIFLTNAENEAYCLEIAHAMTVFFGITEDDAIARVNKQWENTTFGDSDLLYGESPDYWAKWIFFGEQSWRHFDSTPIDSLSRIERKLNQVLDHLGLNYMSVADHVLTLLRQGKKLDAIYLYRKETGVDLKKAKEVIESMITNEASGS